MNAQKRRSQGGFTLIEILVVVVIVGVLATLVAQNLGGTTEQANLAATKSDMNAIKTAAQRFKMQKKRWPEELSELIGDEDSTIRYLDLDEVPKDKWTGAEYVLERRGGRVIVICYGADGEEGTDDDLTSENVGKMDVEQYMEIIKNSGN